MDIPAAPVGDIPELAVGIGSWSFAWVAAAPVLESTSLQLLWLWPRQFR